ncbi:MAG TPA: YwiC-like family protein [Roseiflexaceae bacterium]|nr:YwiC-like family protein [Roseiflexaceae bacterium]
MRTAQPVSASDVRLRLVALPTEHGGWSFLLEPIALGLLVAPSLAGLLLGIAAVGVFLTRHPLTVALGDRRRGKRYPRTIWAERFALLYGLVALVAFGTALLLTMSFWPALLLAAPLALMQFVHDLRKQSRALLAEVAGAWALAAAATALALAGGMALVPALGLWCVLAARAAPAIMYVRTRIQRLRGHAGAAWPALLAHTIGLAVVLCLAAFAICSWLAVLALALLLGRAFYGLAPERVAVRPATIGMQELAFAALTVFLTALGNTLGL